MSELDEQLSVFIAARFFIRNAYTKLDLGNELILGSARAMIAMLMPRSILLLSPRDRNTGYFLHFVSSTKILKTIILNILHSVCVNRALTIFFKLF